MSNTDIHKQTNGNGAKAGAVKVNGGAPNAPVFSKNGLDLNIEMIDELAAGASPMQLKNWISHLEALYETKRADNRKHLKKKVDELLMSNDYSVEELYAARPIPSMDELATMAKNRKNSKQSKRDKMINSILGG